MPGSVLTVQLLHVTEEVYHTAIDASNRPRHHLRYGPNEIRGTRDETGTSRDPTQRGDTESFHHVSQPGKTDGKMYQHECRRIHCQPLHVPHVQEDQPMPNNRLLLNSNAGST